MSFFKMYFDESLELKIQVFNLLGFSGMIASVMIAFVSLLQGSYLSALICLFAAILAYILIRNVEKRISYRLSCWIVVIGVFFILFPILFFLQGGYKSGMPAFFLFAVIYTTIMFEKIHRIVALSLEGILYVGIFLVAYFFPDTVVYYFTEGEYLVDVMVGMIVCGILLILVVLLYTRMYHARQAQIVLLNNELKEHNQKLIEYDEMKSDYLASLLSRVHQMSRNLNEATTIARGSLTLQIQQGKALVNGKDVELTPKEFAVLLLLVQNEEKEVSGEEIFEKVWGMPMNQNSGPLRRLISVLRKKLGEKDSDDFSILSKYGGGYLFTTK